MSDLGIEPHIRNQKGIELEKQIAILTDRLDKLQKDLLTAEDRRELLPRKIIFNSR
jgi:hypothetical protein